LETKKKKPRKTKGENGNFSLDDEYHGKFERLQKRAARFAGTLNKKARSKPFSLQINQFKDEDSGSELDWSGEHIVGTCQDLEKGYLRLTSAPHPSQVRPPDVLERALELVIKKWKNKHDYHHTCEQLKSIRQDLTVQCIRNEFTVKVYEIHGRIAMEMKDHEEFNQCQTQLKLLYAEGMKGSEDEFTAYRILYYIFTKNTMDMTSALANLSAKQHHNETIKNALQIRSAWSLNNYKKFYKVYNSAPQMSSYLVDWFIERERKNHFKILCKVYVICIFLF